MRIVITLLLDTCIFIWLCSAPEKLGVSAAIALDSQSNDRALSLAIVREITPKFHTGKLPLPEQRDRCFEEQLRWQGTDVLPLQRTMLSRDGALQPIHKDSFDRVIAADASRRNLRILSPEVSFQAYGCVVIW